MENPKLQGTSPKRKRRFGAAPWFGDVLIQSQKSPARRSCSSLCDLRVLCVRDESYHAKDAKAAKEKQHRKIFSVDKPALSPPNAKLTDDEERAKDDRIGPGG